MNNTLSILITKG